MESVWNSFVTTYNEAPNAFKLVNYSRSNSELPTLTYKQAKELVNDHKNMYEEQMKRHKSTYTKLNKNNNKHRKHKRGQSSNKFKNVPKPIKGRTHSDALLRSKLVSSKHNKNKHRKSHQYKPQKSLTPKHSQTHRQRNYFPTNEMAEIISLKPIKTSMNRSKSQRAKHSRHRSQTFDRDKNKNNNKNDRQMTRQISIEFDNKKQPIKKRKSKKLRKPRPVNNKYNSKYINKYNICIGDCVLLTQNRQGIILYIGQVHFAKGIWFGIELINGSTGTHDGIIAQKRYFKTAPNRGLFVQESKICGKLSQNMSAPILENSNSGLVTSPRIAETSDYNSDSDYSNSHNSDSKIIKHKNKNKHKYKGYTKRDSNNNINLSPGIIGPLYTKSVPHMDINNDDKNNMIMSVDDINNLKSILRSEIETEFESKFNELKQMLIDKNKSEINSNNNSEKETKRRHKKRHKHRRKKEGKKTKRYKKKKEKKTLDKLKKMEKRRRNKSKITRKQLKQSETELNNNNNNNNNIINDIEGNNNNLSDDYQKNSDLYVTESLTDNESIQSNNENENEIEEDENDINELVIITNTANHGRNISLVSNSNKSQMSPNVITPTTNVSDFDDKDIAYNVGQQLPKRKHFWNTIK